MVLFLVVMGSINAGVATPPKETAAIGAFGAIIIIMILIWQFKTRGFLNILPETGLMTAMFMRV